MRPQNPLFAGNTSAPSTRLGLLDVYLLISSSIYAFPMEEHTLRWPSARGRPVDVHRCS